MRGRSVHTVEFLLCVRQVCVGQGVPENVVPKLASEGALHDIDQRLSYGGKITSPTLLDMFEPG